MTLRENNRFYGLLYRLLLPLSSVQITLTIADASVSVSEEPGIPVLVPGFLKSLSSLYFELRFDSLLKVNFYLSSCTEFTCADIDS